MNQKKEIVLHTGSNLGNRIENLREAKNLIEQYIGKLKMASFIYETEAWGNTNQPDFVNQSLLVETTLTPTELLKATQKVENKMGRVRLEKWGERIIDIDILFYENEVIQTTDLTVPHPLLQDRNFVLIPTTEIIPNWNHPTLNKTIEELTASSTDKLPVNLYKTKVFNHSLRA